MSEPDFVVVRRRRGRQSVYARLVTVMLVMGISLLAIITAYFAFYVMPLRNAPFREFARTTHFFLLATLLSVIAGVFIAAHAVLRHMLRPLRALSTGVTRLSEGEFDVFVPKTSEDEFGTLTDAFNEMVGRVRDMVRARDRLLLDVSHELRSPVTRLKVALELVGDPEMKAKMAGDLAEIEIMIGELLDLERLRGGHGVKAARHDIVAIIESVAGNFSDRPPGVRVRSTAPQIFAQIDADRIRTVFRNLIENAIKYSGPDSGAVDISVSEEGARVVVRVTDDGPGVPEGDVANLFEPFFRVDPSRSKKTGGYGLGLSIARRIVEAHGGTIAAANNEGRRGACFTVTLPRLVGPANAVLP